MTDPNSNPQINPDKNNKKDDKNKSLNSNIASHSILNSTLNSTSNCNGTTISTANSTMNSTSNGTSNGTLNSTLIVPYQVVKKSQTHDINNMDIKNKGGAYQLRNIAKQIREELTEEADIDITGVNIEFLTWMITDYDIVRFDNEEYTSIKMIIPKIITEKKIMSSFSVLDIGALLRQYRLWRRLLPNIEIFYAVKCNPDPVILETLFNLGVGFDVASQNEISMVINTYEKYEEKNHINQYQRKRKMIYANPCKREAYISYARSQNVSLMTFDSKDELLKIVRLHPSAQLVLRITVDDIANSKLKFGSKFGCPICDVENVLEFAKFHMLNIVGVSFHVGSGCYDGSSYANAIKRARDVFEMAKKIGYDCTILDIGGGFPGIDDESNSVFSGMADQIQFALHTYFSDVENLRVIAEPGRFFATSALTHVVRVIGKKSILRNKKDGDLNNDETKERVFHYYIDSNLYGMFNNKIFDKASIEFKLLNMYDVSSTYKSVIFGETCDSMDTPAEGIELPELVSGDYLYVENHGAYTSASASKFNGFETPNQFVIFTF